MIRTLTVMLAIVATLAFASRSEAGLMYGGNTNPSATPAAGADGTVNFAVYQNTGTAGDAYGTGLADFDSRFLGTVGGDLGPFDTTANHLFLYQIVNNGSDTRAINGLSLQLFVPADTDITSFGFFTDAGFFDGAEVSASNVFGVFDGVFGTSTVQDSPTLGGVGDPSVVDISGSGSGVAPTSVQVSGLFLTVSWIPGSIPNDGRSLLFGFTTNYSPGLTGVEIQDGFDSKGTALTPTTGLGDAPPILPEPASMIVWALGAGLVGTVGYFKRRRTVA